MDLSLLWYLLSILLVLVGLAGTIYPALPGLGLLAAGFLLAAWNGNFVHVGFWPLTTIVLLAVAGMVIESVASLLGAQKSGASREALIGALLGGLIGLFFGLFGAIAGPVLGAVVGELIARRNLPQASRVGAATFLGFLAGTVAKIACAFAMLGVFILALLF